MILLVSVHDVTPAHWEEVLALWGLCRDRGVIPALLITPDWHGSWPVEGFPEFGRWLRDCAAAGAEVMLHGERHDEVGTRRRWRDHLRALGRTDREGEFMCLDEAEASERIRRGRDRLRRIGVTPVGFVAPAWIAGPETYRAAARLGLGISEDSRYVYLRGPDGPPCRLASPVCRWSARSALRAHGSAVVGALRWRAQRGVESMRLALHPGDLRHRATRESVPRALERWTANRRVLTYSDLFTQVVV